MDNKGFVSIYRSLQDNPLWKEKPFSRGQAWIDLILIANHKDVQSIVGNKVVTFKRGEVNRSMVSLAERWGWGRKKVNLFLSVLEKMDMIEKKGTSQGTTIMLKNYDKYQIRGQQQEQRRNSVGTAQEQRRNSVGTQTIMINNDNNENNEKKTKPGGLVADKNPAARLAALWNELKPFGIAGVYKIDAGERGRALAVLMETYSPEDFERAVEKVKGSKFLTGKGKKGWRITFDWFIKPENFAKVLEGNYDADKDKSDLSWAEGLEEETENDNSRVQPDSTATEWSFRYASG